MSNECRCGKPTRDDRSSCEDCTDSLVDALRKVASGELETELETTITRSKGVDYRTKGTTRASERPSPVVWSVSEARGHLKAVLVSWVRFAHEERVRNSAPCTCPIETTKETA